MTKRIAFLLIIISNSFNLSYAQQWVKIYESIENAKGRHCIEDYDRGFIIAGFVTLENPTYTVDGWILKTDVNGTELWRKTITDSSGNTALFGCRPTPDGGLITIGSSYCLDQSGDPLVIKFNACKDKEWCAIFNSPNNFDYGIDIEIIPEGGYMALLKYWEVDKSKRIWLFRLSDSGDLIWTKAYAVDSLFYNEEAISLYRTNDTTFIITGYTYWPEDQSEKGEFLTPLLIKVSLNGDLHWEIPWGIMGDYIGPAFESVNSANGQIYTISKRYRDINPFGEAPSILTTNSNGVQITYTDIIDSTYGATPTTIDWYQDSTFAIATSWQLFGVGEPKVLGVFKVDTAGNLLNERILMNINYETPEDATVSNDDKLFLITNYFDVNLWKWQVYAYKLTSNLEYDSMYITPLTYDSLCPHLIESDTIPLEGCEVIVSINDPMNYPEKTELHLYPNPASQKINIVMPKYLIKESNTHGLTATTFYHQWKNARLEVFDLFGRLMFRKEIPQKRKNIEVDVYSWPEGMYVTRLMFMNEVVTESKFVVIRE